jgi:type I restriction enzyme M protein
MAADHNSFANLIWQIADLLRGPYRPPQYERVMLPMTVLRRFDCVIAPTKKKVVAEYERSKGGTRAGDALDFEELKGAPDNINKHLVSYIKGFSANVQRIFEYFELEPEIEIEKMHEANILYLVVSKFADVDLHPSPRRRWRWAPHALRPGGHLVARPAPRPECDMTTPDESRSNHGNRSYA